MKNPTRSFVFTQIERLNAPYLPTKILHNLCFSFLLGITAVQEKLKTMLGLLALMHVYVTQANFTTKPRFEIKNKRSFTEMNSQGSRVEKNTHAQKVQKQKILFTNEACW